MLPHKEFVDTGGILHHVCVTKAPNGKVACIGELSYRLPHGAYRLPGFAQRLCQLWSSKRATFGQHDLPLGGSPTHHTLREIIVKTLQLGHLLGKPCLELPQGVAQLGEYT